MNTKIIAISLAAFIGIIVLGSVLMPIMKESTATEDTFVNDGIIGMNKYGTDESITLFWDHTKPTMVSINGVEVAAPQTNVTVSTGYDWLVRFSAGAITFFYTTNVAASVADGTDLTVTMANGSVTATNTAATPVTVTTTYDGLFVIATGSDYDYVMKDPAKKVYLNGDSEIVGSGMSAVGGVGGFGYTITGSINDGLTVDQFRGTTTTNTEPVITSEEVSDHLDLYQFDKFTFKANDTDLTWNQVIVPHEVTAERAEHFTPGQIAIFDAIPIMIIAAILLGVVALVIRSRTE